MSSSPETITSTFLPLSASTTNMDGSSSSCLSSSPSIQPNDTSSSFTYIVTYPLRISDHDSCLNLCIFTLVSSDKNKSTEPTPPPKQLSTADVIGRRHTYATHHNAQRATHTYLQRIQRSLTTFTQGRPELFLEIFPTFKPEIDATNGLIARAAHRLERQGITTLLNKELKISEQ